MEWITFVLFGVVVPLVQTLPVRSETNRWVVLRQFNAWIALWILFGKFQESKGVLVLEREKAVSLLSFTIEDFDGEAVGEKVESVSAKLDVDRSNRPRVVPRLSLGFRD